MPRQRKKKTAAPTSPGSPGAPQVSPSAPTSGIPPGYEKRLGGVTGKGWLPGQSGNPSGLARHPKPTISGVLRTLLADEQEYVDPKTNQRMVITVSERIARRLLAMALDKGTSNKERAMALASICVILDRSEGKAPQTVRHSVTDKDVADLDEQELASFLGRLVGDASSQAEGG